MISEHRARRNPCALPGVTQKAKKMEKETKIQSGSDHHLLHAKFYFTDWGEKTAKFKFKKRIPRITTNWELFDTIEAMWEFTTSTRNMMDWFSNSMPAQRMLRVGNQKLMHVLGNSPAHLPMCFGTSLRQPQANV